MKTTKFLFAFAVLSMLLSACNKDEDLPIPEVDYLIFGHFFGECQGEECVEIFKLEEGKLYEDSNDTYPGSSDFYMASYSELPDGIFDQVTGLEDLFPAGLLNEEGVVIGQPDAGDWGGLYIEYKSGETQKFWLLDLAKENVSEDYHAFIDAVNAKIQIINQ